MTQKYLHLFAPIKLGNTTFRNRIFASPVSLPDYSNVVGMTDRQKAFYAERARGGAASVSTGDGIVHFETGFMHSYKLQLDNPSIYPSLSDMTRSIRQYGAVPTVELSHGGKFANVSNFIGNMETGRRAYGPDHEFTANGEEVFEMSAEMIEEIAASYGRAAAMAKAAGFGMILIHAGHGWLLQQFMSPRTNHRTDEFGGSFENRMRFTLMVIDSVRKAVGPGFPIEFRMSGAEFTEGGYDLEYGVQIAKAVDGLVDLIHVSAGVHDNTSTFTITHPTMFRDHGCNVYLAARIKQEVKTPVATIGGLTDPEMLEDIIASGKADVVEMGRQLMADPYLPRKMEEGREADITHCIRCFKCMQQLKEGHSMCCAVNPRIGREDILPAVQAPVKALDCGDSAQAQVKVFDEGNSAQIPTGSLAAGMSEKRSCFLSPKTVLVAGGGPAGMSAAVQAAGRGYKVILFEAGSKLGGETCLEEHIPFKYDMYRLGQTMARRVYEAGVEVRLETPLTRELALSLNADAIICAAGAEPVRLSLPGIDGPNVRFCTDFAHEDVRGFGQNVVVVGGGLVGCESAIHFAQEGKKVSIIEFLPEIARDAPWPHRFHILELMDQMGIRVYTSCGAKEIRENGVLAVNSTGESVFAEGDTVLMAVGLKPRTSVADELKGCAPVFRCIGDCLRPAQLFDAITGGYFAGREI